MLQTVLLLLVLCIATVLSKSYTITQFATEAQLSQNCKQFRWPTYQCDIQFKETISVSFIGDTFSGFERCDNLLFYKKC